MQNTTLDDLGMKGLAQRGRGRGCGFYEGRESVAVGMGLVGKHVGEEDKGVVSLSKI